MQFIIVNMELKEKERYELSKRLIEFTGKENEYLNSRYIVEDMINILQDSANNSLYGGSSESASDKFKENFIELFNYLDKLEVK